jgi:hypothetical protein
VKNLIFNISFLILLSCCDFNSNIDYPKTTRIASYLNKDRKIKIFTDSTFKEIPFNGDTNKTYSGIAWLHNTDDFLITEYSERNGRTNEGDIVKIDSNGNIVEVILDCQQEQIAGFLYPSPNDNKLLFKFSYVDYNPANPIGQLNSVTNFWIMDLHTRLINKKIDSIGFSLDTKLNDNPWLQNENQFIYDYGITSSLQMIDDTTIQHATKDRGIYIYDIKTNSHSMLIKDASEGEVSTVNNNIAFILNNDIFIYDFENKTSELFYASRYPQEIRDLRWTADGQYLFFQYYNRYPLNFFAHKKALIRLAYKKKINDNKIPVIYDSSWK